MENRQVKDQIWMLYQSLSMVRANSLESWDSLDEALLWVLKYHPVVVSRLETLQGERDERT